MGVAAGGNKGNRLGGYNASINTGNMLDINKFGGSNPAQTAQAQLMTQTTKKYSDKSGTSKKIVQAQSWGQEGRGKVYSSSYVSQVMQDFSLALHDTEHTRPNQSQASKLYQQAAGRGVSEQKFVELMYEAKKRAQWAALADSRSSPGGPNRAAYFFTTLRGLLGDSA